MSIASHDELPFHEVPRIKTRILAGAARGSDETAVWEQWIESEGYIPLHYHEVEEVLVFLAGEVAITLADQTTLLHAPATVVIPARQIHGLRAHASARVHVLAVFPTAAPTIVAPDGTLRPMPWEDQQGGEKPPTA